MAGPKKYKSREEIVKKFNALHVEFKAMEENHANLFYGPELMYFKQMREKLSKITSGVTRRTREHRNNSV